MTDSFLYPSVSIYTYLFIYVVSQDAAVQKLKAAWPHSLDSSWSVFTADFKLGKG